MSPLRHIAPVLWLLAVPASAAAETVEAFCGASGVVWCGTEDEVSFHDLAAGAAPILWFSPDEPLLRGVRKRHIPQRIDCSRLALDPVDDPSPIEGATVYYQVARVLLREDETPEVRDTLEAERIPLDAVRKLTLRFFFYYEEDFGFGPHIHDLEGTEFQVAISSRPDGWRRARLLSVKAYAHSSDWQSNILQIPDDVVLPLTVLVEEGKHASCPDRNGDGIYTPGYDVNVRVNDAWGLRDIFRSRITGARFRSEEAKPRTKTEDGYRIGPPLESAPPSAVEQRARYEARGFVMPEGDRQTYALVSAHATPACGGELPDSSGGRSFLDLRKRMREEGFGNQGARIHRHGVSYRYGPKWPLVPFRNMAPSYGNDGQSLFMLDLYFWDEAPLFGGWSFLRATRSLGDPDRWALDLAYTPSVSRVIDWYVAAGARWDGAPSGGWDTRFEAEGGLQVRWNVVGFRLGVRARVSNFAISDERLVVEVGLGPFPGGSSRGRE